MPFQSPFRDVMTVSVATFGARPANSAAQNDAAFAACEAYCLQAGATMTIPPGTFKVRELLWRVPVIGLGGELQAEIDLATENVIKIDCAPGDSQILSPAEVLAITTTPATAWGNIAKGQNKIAKATGLSGWMYFIHTSERWVRRFNNTMGTFNKYASFSFTDNDGGMSHPQRVAVNLALTTEIVRKRIRKSITIENVKLRIIGGASSDDGVAVSIQRPNVKLIGFELFNEAGVPIQVGIACEKTCMVDHQFCRVDGLLANGTNYAFAPSNWSHDVSYLMCRENRCRRGLDVQNGAEISVVGGSWPSGIGGHWGHGVSVSGGATIGTYETRQNPSPVHISGGDWLICDCTIVVKTGIAADAVISPPTPIRYLTDPVLVNMREDLPVLSGRISLRNNKYILYDATNMATSLTLVDLSQGFKLAYTPAAQLATPAVVEIVGGTLDIVRTGSVADTASTAFALNLINVQGPQTVGESTMGQTLQGRYTISGLVLDYGALTDFIGTDPDTYIPRTQIVHVKGYAVDGAGISYSIEDLAGLTTVVTGASANLDTSAKRKPARADVYTQRVGVVLNRMAYGCGRRLSTINADRITNIFPSGTSGFTQEGDERFTGGAGVRTDVVAMADLNAKYPAPAHIGLGLLVTGETGGTVPVFSDGNWRRVTDRAIAS